MYIRLENILLFVFDSLYCSALWSFELFVCKSVDLELLYHLMQGEASLPLWISLSPCWLWISSQIRPEPREECGRMNPVPGILPYKNIIKAGCKLERTEIIQCHPIQEVVILIRLSLKKEASPAGGSQPSVMPVCAALYFIASVNVTVQKYNQLCCSKTLKQKCLIRCKTRDWVGTGCPVLCFQVKRRSLNLRSCTF